MPGASRSFLSFKWKAVLFLSVALGVVSGALTLLNARILQEQHHQERLAAHRLESQQMVGLLQGASLRLQQLGTLIPSLFGMAGPLRAGDPEALARVFEPFWSTSLLDMGLETVRFYRTDGTVLRQWSTELVSESAASDVPDQLARQVLVSEYPTSLVDCPSACILYAAVPLLLDGRDHGVVLTAASLAETVVNFNAVAGADVGVLSPLPTGAALDQVPPSRRLVPWGLRVWAITGGGRNLALLQALVAAYPDMGLLQRPVTFAHEGRVYDIHTLALPSPVRERDVHMVVMSDITAIERQIEGGIRKGVAVGLGALLAAGVILLFFLRPPISRLRGLAAALPELAFNNYEAARAVVGNARRGLLPRDEFDILNRAALTLAGQLEALNRQVAASTADLNRRMVELARERNFVTRVLDTAQVVILTQDREGRIRSLNQFGERLLGYSAEAVEGRAFVELLSEGRQTSAVREVLERLVSSSGRYEHEGGLVCRDGSQRQVAWLHSTVTGEEGEPLVLSVGLDVTDHKEAEHRIAWLANHDAMTGLMNRRRFHQELNAILLQCLQYGQRGALLDLDINQFKHVNDAAGHGVGDELLVRVARALEQRLRSTDVLARLGSDEFIVILRDVDGEAAMSIAEELSRAINEISVTVDGRPHRLSVSIGVALYPEHGTIDQELLANADIARHCSKEEGAESRGHLFSPGEQAREHLRDHIQWMQRIQEAVSNDGFTLLYQPILRLRDGAIHHYEVLLRLNNPDGTLCPPIRFIPVAERTGLIISVDHWVIRRAMERLAALVAEGHDLSFSINVSGPTLQNREFLPLVRRALEETGLEAHRVVFEITETAALQDLALARTVMEEVRKLGCTFALDDFGVGFSSFYYLRQMPLDYVKLDGSYVLHLHEQKQDQVLVRALGEVAESFGMSTVAEYVEKEETLELLRSYGIDYAQGYLIGRPQPAVPVTGTAVGSMD